MNTSKILLAGLTVATLSAAPALFADDTDAQTKAREALEQMMKELNTQPPAKKPAPAKPAPAPAPAAKPAPAPAPVTQSAPAPAPAPKPAPVAAPTPAPAPVAKPVPVAAPAPAPAPKPVAQKTTASDDGTFSEVPGPSSTGNIRVGQTYPTPPTPAQAAVPVAANPAPAAQPTSTAPTFSESPAASSSPSEPPKAVTTSSAKAPKAGAYQPLAAPASPFNASKEAQLADLLSKYRADLITPEQYHAERAKIVAAQ